MITPPPILCLSILTRLPIHQVPPLSPSISPQNRRTRFGCTEKKEELLPRELCFSDPRGSCAPRHLQPRPRCRPLLNLHPQAPRMPSLACMSANPLLVRSRGGSDLPESSCGPSRFLAAKSRPMMPGWLRGTRDPAGDTCAWRKTALGNRGFASGDAACVYVF